MATKHTPAPWAQYANTNIVTCKWRGPGAESLRICEVATNTRRDEGRHNLNLIVAAPDMLQTLQDMDGWLANTGHGEDHPWRISVRAAIAKATGVDA